MAPPFWPLSIISEATTLSLSLSRPGPGGLGWGGGGVLREEGTQTISRDEPFGLCAQPDQSDGCAKKNQMPVVQRVSGRDGLNKMTAFIKHCC